MAGLAAKTCLVTVTDGRGVRHTVEVQAESLFEAGALGLSALKKDAWTEGIGPGTHLEVRVHEPAVTHTLSLQQLKRWLEAATISPNEKVRKDRLKSMLSGV
jgi:hypothetical protein